jgi:tetratricopeptide (TPR) repeat protein
MLRTRLKRALLGLWLVASTASAAADDRRELAEKAVASYESGDFAAAAAGFESLLASGAVNGHVYYNLGNTYYRLGRRGEAMAAYLAARRYLPRDPDVRANLKFVLAGVPDKVDTEVDRGAAGALLFWVRPFTPREFAYGAAGAACVAALLLAASLWRRSLRPTALAAMALPVLALCGYALSLRQHRAWGAVTAKTAPVRSGPGAKDGVLFQLREGAPFLVTGSRGADVYELRLSDGKHGWIAVQDAKVFGEL